MKICIDGLSVSKLQGTVLYSYTYGLITNLLENYPQPKYELIWDGNSSTEVWNKYKNVAFAKLEINRRNNDYKVIEDYLANAKVDLYHSPNNGLSIPQSKICKYIITAHDLSPLSCRELVDNKYYNKFTTLFQNAIEKSDCIIAVSEFIKEELVKFYKIPDKKIEVVYPWCSDIFKVTNFIKASAVLKDLYKIEGTFMLYTGGIHTRKNLNILIEAFSLLLKQKNDISLVIVGNYDAKRREYYLLLKNLIQKLGIENNVIFTGTIPYIDMPLFYNCAECTINLSSYDGFPTTAIEAIACDCPVICSRSSSFEEVIGQSAIFLDELDINLLKNSLLDIIIKKNQRSPVKQGLQHHDIENKRDRSINKLVRIYESTVYGS